MRVCLTALILFTALWLAGTPAWGQLHLKYIHAINPQLEGKVTAMLLGLEGVPSDEEWRRLERDGVNILMYVAANSGEWPLLRGRAITALVNFSTVDVKLLFLALLDGDDEAASFIKCKTLRALALGFGKEVLPDIRRLLDDPDFFVREAAVKALAEIGTSDAVRHIKAFRAVEKQPALLRTIDRELKKLGKK